MRRRAIVLASSVLIISFVLTSCEGMFDDYEMDFDSDYIEVEFVIPPVSDTGYFSFPSEMLTTNIDSLLEEEGLNKDAITSVTVKNLIIETSDSATTFDSFSSFEASVRYESDDILFAYQDTIPLGTTSLDCKYVDVDLSTYVLVPEFQLVLGCELIAPIERVMIIKGKVKFKVTAKIADALSETD